jgi:hypothetical protein
MAENTVIVTAGDVIEVQLTSETVVIESAGARHVEPGHTTPNSACVKHSASPSYAGASSA